MSQQPIHGGLTGIKTHPGYGWGVLDPSVSVTNITIKEHLYIGLHRN